MPRPPAIGVICDHNPGNMDKFGGDEAHDFLNARYPHSIADAGGTPWLLGIPQQDRVEADAATYLDRLDGLMMTGCGRHLDPTAYGESPRFELSLMAAAKQAFEMTLFVEARRRSLPVLAICGGMQTANAALGGTLIQCIGEEVTDPLEHMQTEKATHTVHPVNVTPGTRLAKILGCERVETNSSHTQSVARPGTGLTVAATTSDGVIEALEGTDGSWLVMVQWHPEYLYREHPPQARLITAFIDACR
ncbi:MAG: gamma-glutamyl-gamma-aminobutyrate hydrolase family protein [Leptospirillia bacterium]